MPTMRGVISVGLVSAGEMGAAVGGRIRDGGARVVTTLEGRSARTRGLARAESLHLLDTLRDVVAEADVVLSIVPPGEALAVASTIAGVATEVARSPLVADLNAVAPLTVARVDDALGGLELVDGSISGPPPMPDGATRIFLSGARADEIASLDAPGIVWRVVGQTVGLASAVKMSTASVYKGRVALLTQALRAAHANGVLEPVLDDLVSTGLADRDRTASTLARASAKAWRYVPEMREIAATQAAAGLTPDLFEAFAEVWADVAESAPGMGPEEVDRDVALEDVLRLLARQVEPE